MIIHKNITMKTIQFLSFIKQSLGWGKKTKYCFEEHIYHGKLQL